VELRRALAAAAVLARGIGPLQRGTVGPAAEGFAHAAAHAMTGSELVHRSRKRSSGRRKLTR